jgi:hypothetical protein
LLVIFIVIGPHLFKNFPEFYVNLSTITAFRKARHLSLY